MAEFDSWEKETAARLVKKARLRNTRMTRRNEINASVLGVYGWQVALPVFIGLLIGSFLDNRFPIAPASWRFNLIMLGFVLGFLNATLWARREGVTRNMAAQKEEMRNRLGLQKKQKTPLNPSTGEKK